MNGDKEKPAGLKIERHRAIDKEQRAWALGRQSGVNGLPDGQQGEREAVCGQ